MKILYDSKTTIWLIDLCYFDHLILRNQMCLIVPILKASKHLWTYLTCKANFLEESEGWKGSFDPMKAVLVNID